MAKTKRDLSTLADAPPSLDLASCCPDLPQWSSSWSGTGDDIAPGDAIVDLFRPFLLHLIRSEMSRKTIRRHAGNLWILGGEIIRDLYQTPRLRKRPMPAVLIDTIEHGGPLLFHASPQQQQSFDATCKRLHAFLTASGH